MWFHLHEWYILDMAPSLDASGVTREGLGWNPRCKIWAIYNDLSQGHPKWWFSKGIPPKMALIRLRIYI